MALRQCVYSFQLSVKELNFHLFRAKFSEMYDSIHAKGLFGSKGTVRLSHRRLNPDAIPVGAEPFALSSQIFRFFGIVFKQGL